MASEIEKIKILRERTNSGILDIRKALQNSGGDIEKSIEWLRKNGIVKAAKKEGNITAEGIVRVKYNKGSNKVAMIELNSETDFVSSNKLFIKGTENILDAILMSNVVGEKVEDFNGINVNGKKLKDYIIDLISVISENISLRRVFSYKLKNNENLEIYNHSNNRVSSLVIAKDFTNLDILKDISMHIAALKPQYAIINEVPNLIKEKELSIIKSSLENSNKPPEIMEKIVKGSLNKKLGEFCLFEQKFVKDSSKKISDIISKDNFVLFKRFEVGEGISKKENNFAEEVKKQVKNN